MQPRLDDEKSVLVQEKVSAILRRAQTAIEGKLMGLDEAVAAALALVDALEAMVVAARCEVRGKGTCGWQRHSLSWHVPLPCGGQ